MVCIIDLISTELNISEQLTYNKTYFLIPIFVNNRLNIYDLTVAKTHNA